MSVDAGVLVGRRSRAEIERLVALYGSSGMGRIEFCRSQGLALSTLLGRHLSKHSELRSKGVERGRLMPVELAAPVSSVSTSPRPVLAPSVVTALQVEACLHDLLFARPLAPRAEAFACGFAFRNSPTGALDDRPEAQTLMLIGSDYNAM